MSGPGGGSFAGRVARRARHSLYLGADLAWTARINRMWWLVAVIGVILIALLVGGTTQTVAPYAVYTLF